MRNSEAVASHPYRLEINDDRSRIPTKPPCEKFGLLCQPALSDQQLIRHCQHLPLAAQWNVKNTNAKPQNKDHLHYIT